MPNVCSWKTRSRYWSRFPDASRVILEQCFDVSPASRAKLYQRFEAMIPYTVARDPHILNEASNADETTKHWTVSTARAWVMDAAILGTCCPLTVLLSKDIPCLVHSVIPFFETRLLTPNSYNKSLIAHCSTTETMCSILRSNSDLNPVINFVQRIESQTIHGWKKIQKRTLSPGTVFHSHVTRERYRLVLVCWHRVWHLILWKRV